MFCSLVGAPKTALTIVSHRVFLKFIPVMSNIQQMDEIPVGAAAHCDLLILILSRLGTAIDQKIAACGSSYWL
jgi:hypothetical protein